MTQQRLARLSISPPEALARSLRAQGCDQRRAPDASIGARRDAAHEAPIPSSQ
jgi:hypothetical protein